MSTICWICDSLWVRLLEVIPPFDHFAGCTKAYMCDHLSRVFPDAWQASKKIEYHHYARGRSEIRPSCAHVVSECNTSEAGFGWIWVDLDGGFWGCSQFAKYFNPTTNHQLSNLSNNNNNQQPTTTTNNQFIQQPIYPTTNFVSFNR